MSRVTERVRSATQSSSHHVCNELRCCDHTHHIVHHSVRAPTVHTAAAPQPAASRMHTIPARVRMRMHAVRERTGCRLDDSARPAATRLDKMLPVPFTLSAVCACARLVCVRIASSTRSSFQCDAGNPIAVACLHAHLLAPDRQSAMKIMCACKCVWCCVRMKCVRRVQLIDAIVNIQLTFTIMITISS